MRPALLLLAALMALALVLPWAVYRVRRENLFTGKAAVYSEGVTGLELSEAALKLSGLVGYDNKLAPILLYPVALLGVAVAYALRSRLLLLLSSLAGLFALIHFYAIYDTVLRLLIDLGLAVGGIVGVTGSVVSSSLGPGFYLGLLSVLGLLALSLSPGPFWGPWRRYWRRRRRPRRYW